MRSLSEEMNSHHILFIFVDGIGLGPNRDPNPFATDATPTLESLIAGRLVLGHERREPTLLVKGIDATLGVSGLPQSATGQTALFTGVNAAQVAGCHMPAFPVGPLPSLLADFSLLKQLKARGCRVTSANAYSDAYWRRKRPRHAATTLAIMAADIPFRTTAQLLDGEAVYWDITHEIARASYAPELPLITPEEAGRRLARLVRDHHFVLYETFLPDLVGHRRVPWEPTEALRRLDGLLQGLFAMLPEDATVVITSDHGNLEAPETRSHTYNPVPLLVFGPAAPAFSQVTDLTGVTPALLRCFD